MRLIRVQLIKDIERNGRIIRAGSEINIMPELMNEYAIQGIIRLNDSGKPFIVPSDEIVQAAKELKRKRKTNNKRR